MLFGRELNSPPLARSDDLSNKATNSAEPARSASSVGTESVDRLIDRLYGV